MRAALPSAPVTSREREFVSAHIDDLHADLDAWLRIPSISADPAHAADVAASAEWLADALRRTGFPIVEIWPTPGAPAVYAEWTSADPDAPVALVYGHHDVQPVDPPELWAHPPFEPTRVDGPDGPELHGRGASDDKGMQLGPVRAVHAGGLERRVLPQLGRVDRLDVVVPVDERDRGLRVGGRPLGEDGGGAGRRPDLHDREAGAAERVGQPLGAGRDVGGVRGVGRDRRDAHPRVQIGVQVVEVGGDELAFGTAGHGSRR